MTKRRAIYGSAATSISLARCCPEAQLLFDRLISHADDQGRLQGDPMLVRAQCMPLIDRATIKAVDRWLGELAEHGMILRYEANGQAVIQIVKWWEHQDWMRHVYASRWPSPDGWEDRTKGNGDRQPDASLPPDGGKVPQNDGNLPATGGPSRVVSEVVSVSEIDTSRGGDAREPTPPPTLLSKSLTTITTAHHDLTGKEANEGACAIYRDLQKKYSDDHIVRAMYRCASFDKKDYGFVARVKAECKRAAA